MKFILKNNIDGILSYAVGIGLLIVTLFFLFDPAAAENFKPLKQPDYVRLLLGLTEVILSVLFIIPATRIWGASGLLIVFAFAAWLHLRVDLHPFGLIGWAIAVCFVLYCSSKRKTLANRSGQRVASFNS
ncbi:MAG TPA: hypothetical protein VFT78_07020 [Hanamia sp.]|nr:hypothetical protein [Hanamia sp.]